MSTTNVLVIGLIAVAMAGAGCATTTPYISNELGAQIAVTPSPFHEFAYVRAYEDDGELVVYGKLRHNHVTCDREGHGRSRRRGCRAEYGIHGQPAHEETEQQAAWMVRRRLSHEDLPGFAGRYSQAGVSRSGLPRFLV